jgi:hypothetical protein
MTWSELRKEARFARSVLARRPFDLLLQVTNRCNMSCSFCDFWPNGAAAEEELSLDELRRLAAELAGLGTCVVSIEGGEPFVRPDLVEIVRPFARDHLPVPYRMPASRTRRTRAPCSRRPHPGGRLHRLPGCPARRQAQ